ncbi:MAG: hypothetical protein U0228_29745 [Myxococcaceae bacterium]
MDKPKPAPSGSSSDDLDAARAASQRLAGQGGAPPPSPGYVSFPSPRPAMPAAVPVSRPSAAPLMTRRQPLLAPNTHFGADGWNTLLEACAAAVAADAAFLMDASGLIIASRGRDELEAVGARLMNAFEQADRIDDARGTLSLSIETQRGTLYGLRLAQPEGTFLTLGFNIPAGLSAERQARLVSIVATASSTRVP